MYSDDLFVSVQKILNLTFVAKKSIDLQLTDLKARTTSKILDLIHTNVTATSLCTS